MCGKLYFGSTKYLVLLSYHRHDQVNQVSQSESQRKAKKKRKDTQHTKNKKIFGSSRKCTLLDPTLLESAIDNNVI